MSYARHIVIQSAARSSGIAASMSRGVRRKERTGGVPRGKGRGRDRRSERHRRRGVRRLAEAGASVAVVDTDRSGAEELAASSAGPRRGLEADVSREEDVVAYVRRVVERFGRIDLHHLNAGIAGAPVELPDVTAEDFDRVLAVNVRGIFLGLREAFRCTRCRNRRARSSRRRRSAPSAAAQTSFRTTRASTRSSA